MATTKPRNRRRNPWGAIRELESGAYQASYLGPDGVRYLAPHTFQFRSQATDFLAKTRTSIIENSWTSPKVVEAKNESFRFYDYVVRHIELQTNKNGIPLRESTKLLYVKLLNLHLIDFHDMDVRDITKPMVDEWWHKSLKAGKKTTTSKAYKLLSVVMKRATLDEIRETNPCKVVGAHSTSTGVTKYVPTPSEVALLAKSIHPRFSALVMIAAYSGMRYQEFAELRRKDVSLTVNGEVSQYVLDISRAISWVNGSPLVGPTKSAAGTRQIEVHSSLTDLITAHLSLLPEDPETLIFASASGSHLRHDVFMGAWNRAVKKAGIQGPNFTPHSLRHFGATYYAKAGGSLAELQRWLGDSSKAVLVYLHATNQGGHFANLMEIDEDNL